MIAFICCSSGLSLSWPGLLWKTCGRVAQSDHRPQDDKLAQGLVLRKGADRRSFQTALATGCSVWSHFLRVSLRPHEARATYLCGRRLSSRPHLVCCGGVRRLRPAGRPPKDRAQERLFAVVTAEVPPPPAVVDAASYVTDVSEMFQQCLQPLTAVRSA